jgi:hypothetical protein
MGQARVEQPSPHPRRFRSPCFVEVTKPGSPSQLWQALGLASPALRLQPRSSDRTRLTSRWVTCRKRRCSWTGTPTGQACRRRLTGCFQPTTDEERVECPWTSMPMSSTTPGAVPPTGMGQRRQHRERAYRWDGSEPSIRGHSARTPDRAGNPVNWGGSVSPFANQRRPFQTAPPPRGGYRQPGPAPG